MSFGCARCHSKIMHQNCALCVCGETVCRQSKPKMIDSAEPVRFGPVDGYFEFICDRNTFEKLSFFCVLFSRNRRRFHFDEKILTIQRNTLKVTHQCGRNKFEIWNQIYWCRKSSHLILIYIHIHTFNTFLLRNTDSA